ncbi:CBP80/20-dependent translation initiation factor isoform X2 [Salvelinus fontinalis]|uniref:CBP80/20-dependent translation initiation factor isoform X2 n=1 Tax=Salvelinus fontinalis TaxID=8038 RepID=UPI0024855A40|nr:CBP80/20-dependent translation initiation factor isoform X2 [Salvelinus fontinalis]
MENSSVASASSEAGSTRSQEIEELERFIDSYVLEYQVQGLLGDKNEADLDGNNKPQSHISQWTEDCNDRKDGSWSSSRGRGSTKPDEWDHSSNGSTGSRPSSGSRPGSGSRSGSRGRNNQFRGPAKNGNREGAFDILGTDIWAANTMDSHGGATWDLQPEKLDFSQFHRKPFRGTPKHLPHIDREGMMKGKFEDDDDDDGIDLNDMEKFLPGLTGFPPLPNEAEIAHTKKLFRRRRNDRRGLHHIIQDHLDLTVLLPPGGKRLVSTRRQQQQRPPGGGGDRKTQNPQQQSPQRQQPPSQQQPVNQQQNDQQQPGPGGHGRYPRDQQQGGQRGGSHGQQFQGHGGQRQGPPHHGYSQNRRWHHNQKGQGVGQGLQGQGGPAGDRGATPTGDRDRGATPTGDRDRGGAPTGDRDRGETPTGDRDRGGAPTGDRDRGATPMGDRDRGGAPTGDRDRGETPMGDRDRGATPTGDRDRGETPTGDRDRGATPMGDRDRGGAPTGDRDRGATPTGDRDRGATPTGDRDRGGAPTGDRDSGATPMGDRDRGGAPTGDRDRGGAPTGDRDRGGAPTGDRDRGGAPTGDRDRGGAPTGDRDRGGAPTGDRDRGATPMGDRDRGATPMGDRDRGATPMGDRDRGVAPLRNTKETENVKAEETSTRLETESSRGPSEGLPSQPGGQQKGQSPTGSDKHRDSQLDAGPKVSLLQSSKERLRRRLKDKEEAVVSPVGPQQSRMDRLLEILNSMRNNRAGVDSQLSSFMEEAQSSAQSSAQSLAQSEETLDQIVRTIYDKALSDRSFAATAARLCDKMALFMVEGTKFRSLLLNMLQKDFSRRVELQASDVELWLGFITFLCEVFGTMRSSAGEPFRVLVCPIYTCLRELLQSPEVKEDAVLCCSMELQSTGHLLEEQLPEMMTELLATARDKMLCPAESQLTRSLLMEVIELRAHHWTPLEALTTQYYNRTIQKLTTA